MEVTTTPEVEVPRGTSTSAFHGRPGDGHPPDQTLARTGWSMRRASATAGIGLVLMIVPALLGNFVAVGSTIVLLLGLAIAVVIAVLAARVRTSQPARTT